MTVSETDEVMLINSDGIIIRIKASDVSRLGSSNSGRKVHEGCQRTANIIAMAKVVNDDTAGITEAEKTKNASGEATDYTRRLACVVQGIKKLEGLFFNTLLFERK